VIVDLMLPDISGFEVVEELGADPATAALPVIALTAANLSAADRERLEKRVVSLAGKGDFTRESVLLAVQRAIGAAPAGGNGPTMLVVDDHDLNRELIRTLLERKGYRVRWSSGEAESSSPGGSGLVDPARPAMPGKDGFATARELKADGTLAASRWSPSPPWLRGDEERARQAGFDAYVTEPGPTRARRDRERLLNDRLERQRSSNDATDGADETALLALLAGRRLRELRKTVPAGSPRCARHGGWRSGLPGGCAYLESSMGSLCGRSTAEAARGWRRGARGKETRSRPSSTRRSSGAKQLRRRSPSSRKEALR
jgi:CheY-like chemotaxis protein